MAKSPAFQFYPDSWLGSSNILCMTPAEEGAYIHLLCIAWNTDDCSLPDDDQQLAILSRLVEGWFNGGSTKIRKCFIQKDGKLYNERLLKEREKQRNWREKSSLAGKKSAAKRAKGKHKSKVGSTKGQPTFNSQSQSQSIISNPVKSPTVIEQAQRTEKSLNIDKILEACCQRLGIDAFASTQIMQRNFGNHLWGLYQKLGHDEFLRRLDKLKEDGFKAKRLNEVDYLYRELKGFIEPKVRSRVGVIS